VTPGPTDPDGKRTTDAGEDAPTDERLTPRRCTSVKDSDRCELAAGHEGQHERVGVWLFRRWD
jgi:hypothetical protein